MEIDLVKWVRVKILDCLLRKVYETMLKSMVMYGKEYFKIRSNNLSMRKLPWWSKKKKVFYILPKGGGKDSYISW